ncbi:MAG: hypothetical protein AAGD09_03255 [Cyanobacteria bacterium P01_F01_bin.56]
MPKLGLSLSLPTTRVLSSASAGPALWTPAATTKTRGWYELFDASTVTEVGGSITQIADKSINGVNLTQGTSSLQPTYTTGQYAYFNNDVLENFSSRYGLAANPDIAIIIVSYLLTNTDDDNGLFHIGGTDTGILRAASGTAGWVWRFNNGNRIFSSGASILNTWQLTTHLRPAGSDYAASRFFLNGAEVASTSSANPTGVPTNLEPRIYLGRGRGNSGPLDGNKLRIAAVIVMETSDVSLVQRSEGYLAHQLSSLGLVTALDSGHPFKSAAPTV